MRRFVAVSTLAMVILCIAHFGFSQSMVESSGTEMRPDHRIYLHYSEAQIQDISQNNPIKLKHLNYYYQHSWYVKENVACEQCPMPDTKNFDVQEYEHLRHWSRENTIQLGTPGHFIVLKPRKEVQEAYSRIQ